MPSQKEIVKNLPIPPHILLELVDACKTEQESFREISAIAGKNPSLRSKLIRLANSALYEPSQKVENIDQAIHLMGIDAVKNVGICNSVFEMFEGMKGSETFRLKQFWWHSLKCAALARLIAKKSLCGQPEDAFLSGFLHDIGKLVLWSSFPDQYAKMADIYKDPHASFLAGEIQLDTSHAEIGARLLHQWNLPSFTADSIRYHHEPKGRISNALPLVRIVWTANALIQAPSMRHAEGVRFAEEIFNFTTGEVVELLTAAEIELQEVAQSLDIEIEAPEWLDSRSIQNNAEKQWESVQQARDVSLLLGTFQNLLGAGGQDKILQILNQTLEILFDIKSVIFFLYDSEKDGLIGKISIENKSYKVIEELFLPLKMDKSLPIRSLYHREPLNSFICEIGSAPVISDEQLIRFTGKDGILCLPMGVEDNHVGVIVLGLDEIEFSFLQKQMEPLTLFTSYAALTLHMDGLRQNRLKEVQTERMASSAIARKVFHEVNNPLSIIKNYLKILGVKLSDMKIDQDEIRIINEEIDRIALILSDISPFSGETVLKNAPVDANLLISDLAKIMQQTLLKNSMITLHLNLEPTIPHIQAEKNRLKQVFINLIKNAIDSMPKGGNIYLQTRCIEERSERPPTPSYGPKTLDYVEITVADDGMGIPDHIKQKLFEPFVSSKGSGHSGLGLSIVHNIIASFNGKITCESNKNKGTRFAIELPAAENQKF